MYIMYPILTIGSYGFPKHLYDDWF